MLTGWYEREKNEPRHVSSSVIESSIDFTDSVFDLAFTGNAAQQQVPNIDFGNNQVAFDVDALI